MTESLLIRHCAPTLAGIKIAALVNSPVPSIAEYEQWILNMNSELNWKGVYLRTMRFGKHHALIFVYRPEQLAQALIKPDAARILSENGYNVSDPESCLERLEEKLRFADSFPHEIGIFLGYPPADVEGFIQNRGENALVSGPWKVYSDVPASLRTFEKLRRCRATYLNCRKKGFTLQQLTVSGK